MRNDGDATKMPCSWCGKPAKLFVLTHREQMRKKKGVPHVIAPAEYQPACDECSQTLVRAETPEVLRARRGGVANAMKKRWESLF